MTAKEKFIEMSKDITRPGIDRLMAWLEPQISMRHRLLRASIVPSPVVFAHTPSQLQSDCWRLQTCGLPVSIPATHC